MFTALSSAVQSALAPDVPRIVDFRHQWNMFLRFYTENKPLCHKSQPVESTHLTFHLNSMLKLLLQEQAETESDALGLGPCLEYMIHHQVLDILSSICQADTPPGIRPFIFNVFTFLFIRVRQPILAYVNVYFPTRRLLMLSTVVKASPTETQELAFVTALVSKLKSDPNLVPLFAHHSTPGDVSHASSRRSSRSSSQVDLSHIEQLLQVPEEQSSLLENFERKHLVVATLLNFIESADYMVSVKAMDALLVVCSLDDQAAAYKAIDDNGLSEALATRLVKLFRSIPSDVEVAMIEEVKVNWTEAHHLHSAASDVPDFHGKSELVAFFSWFDFCDNLIGQAHETIAESVAQTIRESFFELVLEPCLLNSPALASSPDVPSVLVLAVIIQMWIHIASENLVTEFASWLFGDNNHPELRGGSTHPLKHSLLHICVKATASDVALETLSLFDVILDRPCDHVLQNLVLSNVCQRGYFNDTLAEESINSWSDEEDEREKLRLDFSPKRDGHDPAGSPGSGYMGVSRTMAPTNIARVINAWLYLVPSDLRSTDSAKDSGYEQYVKTAQNQVSETFRKCSGLRCRWPREAAFTSEGHQRHLSDSASSDSRPEADPTRIVFYEGEFLETLFDMLESVVERDYDVNLQVTALLSKLAQIPHPYLHEFLLNPTIPLVVGVRSLYTVMKDTLRHIQERTKSIEQLQRKIYLCRKTLLGSEKDRLALNLTRSETKLIDALIILEEFSKEIAAIALVKFHLSS